MPDRLSMQEIIKSRQRSGFVGRTEELARFRDNFSLPVDDVRHRFLFNVSGVPGVGKTFTLRQLLRIAAEQGALCAYTDERVYDVPALLADIGEQFRQQGERLRGLENRWEQYEERRHQVQADLRVPAGASLVLARLAVRLGLRAARDMPVLGLAADVVDDETLLEQTDQLQAYLARKFRSRDDIRLLLAPTEELSRVLVADLHRLSGRRAQALFFDDYEHTASLLDGWLRDLIDGRFGELPANLTITVASRRPLNPNRWAAFLTEVEHIPLAAFTEAEARQLLAQKNVRDERVVETILMLSDHLPLLVATLAENDPSDPSQVVDPAGSAVEQFLKWEPDERRREIALLAALPMQVDEDVLAALAGTGDARELYTWLRRMSFVNEQGGVCRYHELVREPMLRLQRGRSPLGWRRRHRLLAELFQQWRDSLGLPEEDGWKDPVWQAHALQETYHLLCAMPTTSLSFALANAALACRAGWPFARRWVEMIRQAGRDAGAPRVEAWGERLLRLAPDDDGCWIEFLSLLLDEAHLATRARVAALAQRAECLAIAQRLEDSCADLDQAIRLDPDSAGLHSARGHIHRLMGHLDGALRDFNQALELAPNSEHALASRGVTNRRLGRYAQALADLTRAIELNPNDDWAVANRGDTYRQMGRYEDALIDLSRAIELNRDYEWAYATRGQTYRQMGRYQEAIVDLEQSLELNPRYEWAYATRGLTYRQMGRFEEALIDFDTAIELNPVYAWAIANRGLVYRQSGRFPEALADFGRAIDLQPDSEWALANRGVTHLQLGDPEAALFDLDRALSLRPVSAWILANRAVALREVGRLEEALADLDRALALRPTDPWALARRGETHRLLGQLAEALADFDRVLETDPENCSARYGRALVMFAANLDGAARADLDLAIAAGRRLVAEHPSDAATHFRLALVEAAAGASDRAETLFRRALSRPGGREQAKMALNGLHELGRALPRTEPTVEGLERLVLAVVEESGFDVSIGPGQGETQARCDDGDREKQRHGRPKAQVVRDEAKSRGNNSAHAHRKPQRDT